MDGKMKFLKVFLMFVLLLSTFSIVSSQPPFEQTGTFDIGFEIKFPPIFIIKQNTDYKFHFHLFNITNGVPIGDEPTDCLFHLYNSTGSHMINTLIDYAPEHAFNEWAINIDKGNFSITGMYSYIIQCNSTTLGGFDSVEFEVNPTGFAFSIADAILYSLFSIILFGIILAMFFFIFTMPSSNEKGDEGFDTKVIKVKYFRVMFIAITYPLIIVLLNFLNALAVNFSSLTMFAGTLGFLFETMLRLAWAFTVIIIAWIIVMLVKDTNLNKRLKEFNNIKIP